MKTISSLFGVIVVVAVLSRATCFGQCEGDFDYNGRVTIAEIVRAVRSSLRGCEEPDQGGVISLSTNGVRFRNGETVEVWLELTSGAPATWWSWYPPGGDECRFRVTIGSSTGFRAFDIWEDPSWRSGCLGMGSNSRRNIFTTPPARAFYARFPLRGNIGSTADHPIVPGFYLLEATVTLGRSSSDGVQRGIAEELRSGMIIEIVE